jgi:hypothetical protein
LPSPSHFLIAHGADPKRWARKHDIEPFSCPCDGCGRTVTTSVPFACGQFRGLIAPTCPCGHEFRPYCVVRAAQHGDLFTGGIA